MTYRLISPAPHPGAPLAVGYLVGPVEDAAVRAALPGCAVVADVLAPHPPALAPAAMLAPAATGPLVLFGWSNGGQSIRELLAMADGLPSSRELAAVVIADGTHAPLGVSAKIEIWRDLAARARRGELLFVASCTQNTYVERLPAGPYMSTRSVLDRMAGQAMAPGTALHEGGLHLYSYPSGACDGDAHVAALRALPGLLSRHVAPWLDTSAPAAPARPSEPPDTQRASTPYALAVLDAARATMRQGVTETPPGSNRHPWIDAALKACGAPVGSAWCAAAATAWLREATRATGFPCPVAGSPGARALLAQWATLGRTTNDVSRVYPGCLAFWPRGTGWQGHVGVVQEVRDGLLNCIEGNAGPGGGGVVGVAHGPNEERLGFALV